MFAIIVAAVLGVAAAVEPPPPATVPVTAQGLFDAGSAAAASGKCAVAVDMFEALEAKLDGRKSPSALAVVRIRKGDCLYSLGQTSSAETELRTGVTALINDTPTYHTDIALAHEDLGRIAFRALNYDLAKHEFELIPPGGKPIERFDRLLWLTRSSMFEEGDQALGYADQALAIAAAMPDASTKTLADVHTLRARVLLNHGKTREAYAELKSALTAQGGLTNKVGASELVTRYDLALAALFNRDDHAARKYLAYTGAGQSAKEPFDGAVSMEPPACGGAADLRPDDVAVVEFGINDDGSIAYADPIYVSRNGRAALAFAGAVADWSWRPADAKVLRPLFRLVTRVELRCSTASERPSVTHILKADLDEWLTTKNVAPVDRPAGDAAALAPLEAELAKRQAAGGGVALVPVLLALAHNSVADPKARDGWRLQARGFIAAAGAPPTAIAYADLLPADPQSDLVKVYRRPANPDAARKYLNALLPMAEYVKDARASAAIRLVMAEAHIQTNDQAAELLGQVVADGRLTPHDPLRVAALLQLATLQARKGNLDAARVDYKQTGLSAQQCALVDARPVFSAPPITDGLFPAAAAEWGFEGWVRTEYDIAPDGGTLNQRAVIAYPAFVFRDAAVALTKRFHFSQTYRPDGGPGCSGADQLIRFRFGR